MARSHNGQKLREIVQKIVFLYVISQNIPERIKSSSAWLKYKLGTATWGSFEVLSVFWFRDKTVPKVARTLRRS